jgi:uncharacterized protein YoxC
VSLGQVAALIAAIAFLLLCGALAVPLFRLPPHRRRGDADDQTTSTTGPVRSSGNVNTTLENVNTALTQAQTTLDGVNVQLARIDTITEHVSHVTANVANLTTVVTSAAASPLAKAAAFGFGLRRAAPAGRRPTRRRSSGPAQGRAQGAAQGRCVRMIRRVFWLGVGIAGRCRGGAPGQVGRCRRTPRPTSPARP